MTKSLLVFVAVFVVGCGNGYGMRDRELDQGDDGMDMVESSDEGEVYADDEGNYDSSMYRDNREGFRKAPFGYATFKSQRPMSRVNPEMFEEFLKESDIND